MSRLDNNQKEERAYQVMQLVEANPDLTQRELAKQLGISLGLVNYCIKALIDVGFIKMQSFVKSKNKFGYVYVLTPKGIAEKALITESFLSRKIEEYKALKEEIEKLKQSINEHKT